MAAPVRSTDTPFFETPRLAPAYWQGRAVQSWTRRGDTGSTEPTAALESVGMPPNDIFALPRTPSTLPNSRELEQAYRIVVVSRPLFPGREPAVALPQAVVHPTYTKKIAFLVHMFERGFGIARRPFGLQLCDVGIPGEAVATVRIQYFILEEER